MGGGGERGDWRGKRKEANGGENLEGNEEGGTGEPEERERRHGGEKYQHETESLFHSAGSAS